MGMVEVLVMVNQQVLITLICYGLNPKVMVKEEDGMSSRPKADPMLYVFSVAGRVTLGQNALAVGTIRWLASFIRQG